MCAHSSTNDVMVDKFFVNLQKICQFAKYFLQEYKKDWSRPINLFTQFRLPMGIIPGALVCLYPQDNQMRLIATFFFIIVAAMDFLDGYWARKYQLVTDLGRMIDPMVDKIFAIYTLIMLAVANISDWTILYFSIFVFVRELIVGGYMIYQKSQGLEMVVVFSGKVKTFVISTTTGLIFLPLVGDWEYIVWASMILSIIVSIWSGVDYWRLRRKLKDNMFSAAK